MHNRSDWPQMVFRAPGPVVLEGYGYEYTTVAGEEAMAQALADGWHKTIDAARAAHEKAAPIGAPKLIEAFEALYTDVAQNAPPTRAELEQKAKELGLKFDGRTTDKKLAALIAEKV